MNIERDSNIEILRIYLMTLIVFGHILCHGLNDYSIHNLYAPLFIYHVDCFVIISGYFGIKWNIRKVLIIYAKIVFYGIVSMLIGWHYLHKELQFLSDNIRCIFPFSYNDLWFMECYVALMLLAPFINDGFEKLKRKSVKQLITLFFLFSASGFAFFGISFNNFLTFILLYLIGRYLRFYPSIIAGKIKYLMTGIIVCVALLFLGNISLGGFLHIIFFRYNNPIIILLAVLVFLTFKAIHIGKITIVNKLASGVLAAYLISDTIFTRGLFETFIIAHSQNSLFLMLIGAFLFVIVMSCIDLIISKSLKWLFFQNSIKIKETC